MYYKIENQESNVYKELHKMRTNELQIGKDNIAAVENKIGEEIGIFLGRPGQQNFTRTTEYHGFQFTRIEKIDLKVWKKDKDHPDIFIPNNRTKLGREMSEFLRNGLKKSIFYAPFDILGINPVGRFIFPYVEICGGLILLFLDDKHEPKDPNVIEITRREFEALSGETFGQTKIKP